MRQWTIVGACVAIVAGVLYGGGQVYQYQRGEFERVSSWRTLTPAPGEDGGEPAPHMELLRARLQRGEDVVFEICSRDNLDRHHWLGAAEFVLWVPESQEVLVRAELDADLLGAARRSRRGSCFVVAQGRGLDMGGEFAIEAVWEGRTLSEHVRAVPLRARIVAHRPLATGARSSVLLIFLGMVVLIMGLTDWTGRPHELDGVAPLSLRDPWRVGVGIAALSAAIALVWLVPAYGPLVVLAKAMFLASVEVAIAVAALPALGPRLGHLAWVRPSPLWSLALAPVAGVALWYAGGIALRLVPRAGEAPIETIAAWPSGSLAVALVALTVPIAEELFFRGFVYGAVARRFGNIHAFWFTVALFAAAHVPQDWGAWGALVAVLTTGVGLTALRWWTRSLTVTTAAHLVHNGIIIGLSMASGL